MPRYAAAIAGALLSHAAFAQPAAAQNPCPYNYERGEATCGRDAAGEIDPNCPSREGRYTYWAYTCLAPQNWGVTFVCYYASEADRSRYAMTCLGETAANGRRPVAEKFGNPAQSFRARQRDIVERYCGCAPRFKWDR